ncbi:hypothetical protein DPMN_085881 [Dreissena polymorpha]|uniref:Uncharacterized protein n=1 Tax=Dreissena polymorpha TaxID=45954 RepID=A0A9D4BD85_DREPO|nr:hypothetical protein DPMN_085881 [Dreissena polymorpha]
MTCDFTLIDRKEFVLLLDSLCSRLTLLNARRGGEPSRLKIAHYLSAKEGKWVDNDNVANLSECDKKLFSEMIIGYQPGKGNHLVPVLIPKDCVRGLDILCDQDVRKNVQVLETNDFLFPHTSLSHDHVGGWTCINKMCLNAKLLHPEKLTASKQRHRISTLYSALQAPESEKQYFYKHMGHSKDVNLGTYQYPQPIMEVIKVGRHLQDIDKGLIYCILRHSFKIKSYSNRVCSACNKLILSKSTSES